MFKRNFFAENFFAGGGLDSDDTCRVTKLGCRAYNLSYILQNMLHSLDM